MWLHICQGLMLLDIAGKILIGMKRSLVGQKSEPPSGAYGVIGTIIGTIIYAAILWRSGAISTIVGAP